MFWSNPQMIPLAWLYILVKYSWLTIRKSYTISQTMLYNCLPASSVKWMRLLFTREVISRPKLPLQKDVNYYEKWQAGFLVVLPYPYISISMTITTINFINLCGNSYKLAVLFIYITTVSTIKLMHWFWKIWRHSQLWKAKYKHPLVFMGHCFYLS